jgi:serine/threonine protein kinase
MTGGRRCARCGSPVSADRSGEGLCPRCLLAGVLGDEDARDLTSPHPALEPRYRILTVLGEGRSGRSLLATGDRPAGRLLVVKIFPAAAGSGRLVERLDAVARLTSALAHPGIVPTLEIGTTTDGRPLAVRQYQQGSPLATHCERSRLDVAGRLAAVRIVCDTVGAGHEAGLTHGHLVSANLLASSGSTPPRIAIVDWGHTVREPDRASRGGRTPTTAIRDDIAAIGELLETLIDRSQAGDAARRLATAARRARQTEDEGGYGSIAELADDVGRMREELRV